MSLAIKFFLPLIIFSISGNSKLEVQQSGPSKGNYIVVAAYGKSWESLAQAFADKVSQDYPEVTYAFFEGKNMFMVYLEYTTDFKYSIKQMRQVRREGKHPKTWVYVYGGSSGESRAVTSISAEMEKELDEEESTAEAKGPALPEEAEEVAEPAEVAQPEEPAPVEEEQPEEEVVEEEIDRRTQFNYRVYFAVFNSQSRDMIDAEVQLIDPSRGRNFEKVSGNQIIFTDGPDNNSHDMQAVVDHFGYRKLIHTFNLDKPDVDSTAYFVQVQGDSMIIEMPLVKYHKGDIFTLFNVYFFSHSSVMKPESKYELDQLLAMLKENPNLRIKLHGHTNGGSQGVTKYHQHEDPEFFTLTGSVEKTSSAKELSEMRANEVKRYLEFSDIDPSRMEVIGWGGKKMLYKKLDPNADKNVRVEVEILDE